MAVINRANGAQAVIAAFLAATIAVGADQRPLQINVLEGEGAFNDIKKGLGRAPIVEIKDEAGQPVDNAKVVFQLPEMGASGTFIDGSRTFVGTSNAQGRAAAPVLKPNKVEGTFAIIVTASKEGSVGRAEVRESNTLAGGVVAPPAGNGGHSKVGIWIAIAGAAGGIAIAAVRSGGSKSSSSTGTVATTPTTFSVGAITIGGPR